MHAMINIHLGVDYTPTSLPKLSRVGTPAIFPETGLHPSKVTSMVEQWVAEGSTPYHIVTHSEHLVNALGAAVEERKLSSSGVIVHMGGKRYRFDSDGRLFPNWPYGWFN